MATSWPAPAPTNSFDGTGHNTQGAGRRRHSSALCAQQFRRLSRMARVSADPRRSVALVLHLQLHACRCARAAARPVASTTCSPTRDQRRQRHFHHQDADDRTRRRRADAARSLAARAGTPGRRGRSAGARRRAWRLGGRVRIRKSPAAPSISRRSTACISVDIAGVTVAPGSLPQHSSTTPPIALIVTC